MPILRILERSRYFQVLKCEAKLWVGRECSRPAEWQIISNLAETQGKQTMEIVMCNECLTEALERVRRRRGTIIGWEEHSSSFTP